jgi:putative tricarboxylic transport membrane protein
MLAGIYYGAQYGGSTTAILVNLPGESSSVVTCIDGYQMAQKGRAGAALAIAAVGSLFAGCVGTVLIAAFAPVLAAFAVKFRSPEYFALMLFGLIAAVILAHGSVVKAIGMVILGLLVGLVGTESQSATSRFTFGVPELFDGVDFVPLAMGLFGLAEIMSNLDRRDDEPAVASTIASLWPTREEIGRAAPAVLRGTAIGSLLGILPGGGAVLASFAAYTLEKKVSRHAAEFGKGAVEGVAAPESANNAGAQTSFIPLLTLGIPSNPVMALMIGAMMIQGIQPGPQVMTSQPQLFWGVIASMWLGNLMLVVLNLPLVGVWVALLRVPYRLMFPAIVLFCCIGTYATGTAVFDVWVMLLFSLAGVFFMKVGAEPAPFILGFVLGPLMEENFRRAMYLSRGDPMTFVERPISALLLALAAVLLVVLVLPAIRAKREEVFRE